MAGNLKSQNLSIMLTDIQGYTDASSASSREEIVGLIRRHNRLMVPIISFYGGKIVKSIGDALLCTFASATDAVVCSIIIQVLLKEYNTKQQDASKKMKLRVVINTGDVSIEKNDIFGDAVNVTARVEGLACFPGGSIGITETTYLMMNKNEIVAEKIGPQTLKGIPEPVTVYKVPLEKQKLNQVPQKLAQLVEKAIASGDSDSGGLDSASAQFNEWTGAVTSFLKEKKWGENIGSLLDEAKLKENLGSILDEKKIRQNISNIQKTISTSLTQKSVLETKQKEELNDAPMTKRLKSFIIDFVILFVISTLISYVLWWPVQKMIWGTEYVTIDKMLALSTKAVNDKSAGAEYDRLSEAFPDKDVLGGRHYRRKGIVEWFISRNVDYPFLLWFLYFGIFWALKGASPGQIVSETAVVKENGDSLDFVTAFKRSLIFVPSISFFFIGALFYFGPDKKTLYDKLCETRVVE